jgi:hypothetical protein
MFLDLGLVLTHEAVREWEAKLAPVLTDTFMSEAIERTARAGKYSSLKVT